MPPSTEACIQQALQAFTDHQSDRAEQLLHQAIELDPEAIAPRYHLSNLYLDQARYSEAVSVLDPIRDDAQVRPQYLWLDFLAQWMAGQRDTAFERVQQAIPLRTLSDAERQLISDFALENGYFRLYLEYTDLTREHADQPWIRFFSAVLSRMPRALWTPIVQRQINHYDAHYRHRRKKVLLLAATLSDPGSIAWKVKLAQAYRLTRDVYDPRYAREKSLYQAVLRVDPNHPEARDGFVQTLYDMRAWRELDEYLTSLPPAERTDRHTLLLAECKSSLGVFDQARELYSSLQQSSVAEMASLGLALLELDADNLGASREHLAFPSNDTAVTSLQRFFTEVINTREADIHSLPDGQSILDTLSLPFPAMDEEPAPPPEHANCFLCGTTKGFSFLWKDTQCGWNRFRCPSCSMISVAPIPTLDEILALYKQSAGEEKSLYRIARDEVHALQHCDETHARLHPLYKHFTEWGPQVDWHGYEQSLGSSKRFLDVGCSAGKTVLLFQLCGWDAVGIDVDRDAIAFSQQQGLPTRNALVSDLIGNEAPFDFVTLTDVIEHVQNPSELCREIHALINPGGYFFVKTPCLDSLPHHILGDRILESREHLHFFSRKTLCETLHRSGFETVSVKQSMDGTTPYIHYPHWSDRLFPQRLESWTNRLNVGDTISILARKK